MAGIPIDRPQSSCESACFGFRSSCWSLRQCSRRRSRRQRTTPCRPHGRKGARGEGRGPRHRLRRHGRCHDGTRDLGRHLPDPRRRRLGTGHAALQADARMARRCQQARIDDRGRLAATFGALDPAAARPSRHDTDQDLQRFRRIRRLRGHQLGIDAARRRQPTAGFSRSAGRHARWAASALRPISAGRGTRSDSTASWSSAAEWRSTSAIRAAWPTRSGSACWASTGLTSSAGACRRDWASEPPSARRRDAQPDAGGHAVA